MTGDVPGAGLQVHVRYLHGQVRATPWNVALNSGEVEWPPSPWRIARALLSVWHLRRPGFDAALVERVAAAVAEPAWYLTPETRQGHTRHYLPLSTHRRDATGGTAKALDPHLSIDPSAPVVVHWPSPDLGEAEVEVARELFAAVTYLGRAESVVEARLVLPGTAEHVDPGSDLSSWWRPGAGGATRVLCGDGGVTRSQLEVAPADIRKAKLSLPQGARWVDYAEPGSPTVATSRAGENSRTAPTAIRWRLSTTPEMRGGIGVLATEALRRLALGRALPREREKLLAGGVGAQRQRELLRGKTVENDPVRDHMHASWFWLGDPLWGVDGASRSPMGLAHPRRTVVRDLALWVPEGLPTVDGITATLAGLVDNGYPSAGASGYVPEGFVSGSLQVMGVGDWSQVIPELAGPADTWVAETPYLPVRHRKQKRDADVERYVEDDVRRELAHRSRLWEVLGVQAPEVVSVEVGVTPADQEAARLHRRYRWSQSAASRRDAFAVRLHLARPFPGPLSLGALSHFGFGRFRPER
ncbi:type I-U CRISPR-associated protein Cas5/Cas6 [Kytococcus schroeteri]|uniref:Type I-U CRISPR-associated protein Cas5/Cas6 n=1 Tax=Kytococcus schroeteri TaxID=138300 RepID=A0A2I1PAB6_9MICO|nr:type I-U CRISPR-associated protein Csb2 [Kytococcus schroeteri]PKZ41572.1 type I-U CRISPR-associated protein Cas5/Cas6 [Kytococcus schroeteri]